MSLKILVLRMELFIVDKAEDWTSRPAGNPFVLQANTALGGIAGLSRRRRENLLRRAIEDALSDPGFLEGLDEAAHDLANVCSAGEKAQ
jgi:hypothetical protein